MATTIDLTRPKEAEGQIHNVIGAQLRQRRHMAGLSQENLAKELQVTFQQYQKYENGKNRISAGKLYLLAQARQVPVGSLFPQLNVQDYDPAPPRVLQIMRRISRVISLHPDEMSAISKALVKICDSEAEDGQ